jgi:hypothetical protein
MARHDLSLVRGETLADVVFALTNPDDTAYDLTGASARLEVWTRPDGCACTTAESTKLIELRSPIQEGERMSFLFWTLNFFCFVRIVTKREDLMDEAYGLVEAIDPTWDFGEEHLSTLLQKSIDHCAGKTVLYQGQSYPPLYTPTNDYLVKLFCITPEEQRQLTSIRSTEVAHEFRLASHTKFNRKRGKVPRQDYLASVANDELKAKVLELRSEGLSKRAISERLEISRKMVYKILSTDIC